MCVKGYNFSPALHCTVVRPDVITFSKSLPMVPSAAHLAPCINTMFRLALANIKLDCSYNEIDGSRKHKRSHLSLGLEAQCTVNNIDPRESVKYTV